MKFVLSPKSMNLMQECEKCFWLSVVKKIHRPDIPVASIVTRMDGIIKNYFDRYRAIDELPPIIKENVNGKLPRGMPKTLYYDFGNGIVLMGKPDDYLEIENKVIAPFDHKTRDKEPKKIHPSHQLQMDIYSYLLRVNCYKTKNIAYLAYYYPEDCDLHRGLDIRCKVIEVKTNLDRVKMLLVKAYKILNSGIPENGSNCKFCKWRGYKIR